MSTGTSVVWFGGRSTTRSLAGNVSLSDSRWTFDRQRRGGCVRDAQRDRRLAPADRERERLGGHDRGAIESSSRSTPLTSTLAPGSPMPVVSDVRSGLVPLLWPVSAAGSIVVTSAMRKLVASTAVARCDRSTGGSSASSTVTALPVEEERVREAAGSPPAARTACRDFRSANCARNASTSGSGIPRSGVATISERRSGREIDSRRRDLGHHVHGLGGRCHAWLDRGVEQRHHRVDHRNCHRGTVG